MPKVSVIIPCYNQGLYVDEAVDSILSQTFQDFEIIIINDGSSDDFTNSKLINYNKPKTKVIHTTNHGLSASRNNGIKASKSEYILVLDADDEFEQSFIQKAVVILDNEESIVAVSSWVIGFGSCSFLWKMQGGESTNFLFKNSSVSAGLFRRNCWEAVGGYDETMTYGAEDWDFWLKIIGLGYKLQIINEPLFFYRQKQNSMRINNHKYYDRIFEKLFINNQKTYYANFKDIIINQLYENNNIIDKNDFNEHQVSTKLSFKYYFLSRIRSKFFNKLRRLKITFRLGFKEWKVQKIIKQKVALEVGGPSKIFNDDGLFPVYKYLKQIDLINFSTTTIWQGVIKEGISNTNYNGKQLYQFISDLVDMKVINDGSYEVVIASHVLEHIANPIKALREIKRILKPDGLIIIALPHKDATFDHKRAVTNLNHIISDFNNDTQETDLTHLEEIIEKHDLSMDLKAGDLKKFVLRSLNNFDIRALHHHVFNTKLAVELIDYVEFEIVDVFLAFPYHIFISARKKINSKPDNSIFIKNSSFMEF